MRPGTSKNKSNIQRSNNAGTRPEKAISSRVDKRLRTNVNDCELNSSTFERANSNFRTTSRKNVQPSSLSRRPKHQSILPAEQPLQEIENRHSRSNLKTLINQVNQLTNTFNKYQRRLIESDRRLARVEVTINKSFLLIGDLTNALNTRMALGQLPRQVPIPLPRGYRKPRLPIKRLSELTMLKRDLKNQDFFSFLVSCLMLKNILQFLTIKHLR